MTESDIQRDVLNYLTRLGYKPRRYNCRVYGSSGRLHVPIRKADGKPDKGHPDIGVRTKNARIWIECKGGGKQSDEQKAWQKECEENGEIYILARGLDDITQLFGDRNV